ncbi:alpha/beta hydrolase [Pseudochryseolinea flava]|uniref:Alpha/beta hydrolase n=1 Tax=Pseudochryseolinea flava TaxID=2059302 RepID=A0A364XXE5_9BACT|nr:alpha/beta hydrolase [Pseudochryseolinea flava]RAV99114.1 alpha/beta hydrolase [Pseudochryseolinea flava]
MPFKSVKFSFEARYATLGELSSQTKSIWFVIHGYGQLAQYFIRKFTSLESAQTFFVAPEGLSKFYLEDVQSRKQSGNNRVGSSWMTKENRQMDIANYITYLNAVYDDVTNPAPQVPITFLGFSQGAATVSRWATQSNRRFDRLILWAGVFPPDMDFAHGGDILKHKETHLVYGTQDPFLNDERFTEMRLISNKLGINPTHTTFEGGHDIDSDTLKKFI